MHDAEKEKMIKDELHRTAHMLGELLVRAEHGGMDVRGLEQLLRNSTNLISTGEIVRAKEGLLQVARELKRADDGQQKGRRAP
jgi:hypothetical protein